MHGRTKFSGWVAVVGLFAAACGPSPEEQRQLAELPVVTAEKERLQGEVDRLTSQIRQIEGQLASLGTGTTPAPATVSDLVARFKEVEGQLAAAEGRLRSVNATSAAQAQQMAALEAAIAQERAALESHRQTIAGLEASVSRLEGETASLMTRNQGLEQTIERMTNEANTVWYVVGTKEELLDRGIIREEGGSRVLFIFGKRGKTLVPSPAGDATTFTRADQRTLSQISLPSGGGEARWTVVTPQDEAAIGSPMDQNGRVLGDALRIADPTRFWARSRYLIVVRS